jgi:hypothetical protein
MEFELTHTNGINIPHLSASTINSFITSRFGFYQSKVLGSPFQGNQYTARGTAVEHGVNTWIENPGIDPKECYAYMFKKFDEEVERAGLSRMTVEEVRDSLEGLLAVALKFYMIEFKDRPAVTQHKFECNLEGVKRPIIGYLDYFQQDHAVRDSKVTSKTPSKLSQNYILQGALYRKAKKTNVYFDFFIPNKTPVHKPIVLTDDEFIFGISYLTRAAQVIEEIEECDNPKRMMELMSFPNLDDFWTFPEKKAAADKWDIILK